MRTEAETEYLFQKKFKLQRVIKHRNEKEAKLILKEKGLLFIEQPSIEFDKNKCNKYSK